MSSRGQYRRTDRARRRTQPAAASTPVIAWAASAAWRIGSVGALAGDLGHRLAEDPERGRHLGLADGQRPATSGRDDLPHSRTSSPRWKAAHWTSSACSAVSNSMPSIRPRPRTSRTSAGKRVEQRRETRLRLLAAGPGVVDEPALEQVDRRERRRTGNRVAAVGRAVGARAPGLEQVRPGDQRASGIPLAMPLAVRRMSGLTPHCSIAHIVPVRPAPDWISSATRRIPWRSQSSRRPSRKPSSGTM